MFDRPNVNPFAFSLGKTMGGELSSTLQDYLEAIFRIERQKRVARVRDISRMLSVGNSTVTAALRSLAHKGLVNYEPYEPVTLSREGHDRAARITERHQVMKHFLETVLDIEPSLADSNACRMEHAIDEEVLDQFVCLLAFINQHPHEGAEWLGQFERFRREGPDGQGCRDCIERYLQTLRAQRSPSHRGGLPPGQQEGVHR